MTQLYMKPIFFLFFPLVTLAQSTTEKFCISGSLNEISGVEWVYFKTSGILDSTRITNNKFFFSGNLSEPGFAALAFASRNEPDPFRKREQRITFFLASGTTEINVSSGYSYDIKSAIHNQFINLVNAEKKWQKEIDLLWKRADSFKKADDENAYQIWADQAKDNYQKKIETLYANLIRSNPSSPLSVYALTEFMGWMDIDVNKSEHLFNMLPAHIQSWPSAILLKQRLETAKKTMPGNRVPQFSLPDTTGKMVSISSFKGKYLLIDFWASWCGPCRKQNPALIKIYEKYKNKGFEILGISLDKEGARDQWTRAILKDKLTWMQLSDLKGFESDVAILFGIKGIPSNILIDDKGIILAKNLSESEMDQWLSKLKTVSTVNNPHHMQD